MKTLIWRRTIGVPLLLIVVLLTFVGVGIVQAAPTAPACQTQSWRIVSSANPSIPVNVLNSVTAFSEHDVWAVGQSQFSASPTSSSVPLVEHWDGKNWRVIPTLPSGLIGAFVAVTTIPGTHELWAVGSQHINNPGTEGLIALWNGNRWKNISSPAVNAASFSGVVALSATNAWAVGASRRNNQAPYTAAIEHWNGRTWSQVLVPVPSDSPYSILSSITAFSATDVWAVGSYGIGFDGYTLIEHWNGRQWEMVSAPNPGPDNHLVSVTTIPHTNHLWATGYWTGGLAAKSFLEYWNGKVWSVVPTVPVGITYQFSGVVALSAKSAWMVGSYSRGPGGNTLTEYWNGTTWKLVASPNAAAISSLNGLVRVPGSATLWAVGSSFSTEDIQRTLTERYRS